MQVLLRSEQCQAGVLTGAIAHACRAMAMQNKVFKSYLGLGYYNTYLPPVIQRNLLENPWLVHPVHAPTRLRSLRGAWSRC